MHRFLELPKFTKGLDELKTGLDVWLYFLRHGKTIDETALSAVLARPIIVRAIEVLKMITQSEIEREKERGEHIGLIRAYERILQRPATPEEQLSAMSPEDLTRLAAELEKQALSRG